jgi:hypothetical protein
MVDVVLISIFSICILLILNVIRGGEKSMVIELIKGMRSSNCGMGINFGSLVLGCGFIGEGVELVVLR